ncbi:FadR/GntR family transcriptional regulator [Actinomadura livida]|uniref:DNA-binding FadR family transcriptional regulator n=1 Tax=Actinomadura livida TaxID=79909 RepID=A0A7W7IIL1_9ACTN|nr:MULTISPECIES: FCD domain-containing protein [Actinomadura]MBB4777789.1 DNA-binding FadR family transcriptional regulator [Actinomadura catellatispora]GGT98705.1 GntR family transcriptional regulator [Actinomadura livida]
MRREPAAPRDRAPEPVRIPRPAGRGARTSALVASSIRSQIARGELRPGDRFPTEDELMEVFGIARSTLREALRILESEGLVTVLRGRNGGPRVTRPTVEHISRMFALLLQIEGVPMNDLYASRAAIEPWLARMFAETHTPEALADFRAAVDAAADAAHIADGTAFGEAAALVHEKLFEHAGNASMALFARLLSEVVSAFYRRSGQVTSITGRRRAVRSYRRFCELVEARDADAAEAHWRLHMSHTAKAFLEQPVELFPAPDRF